MSRSPTRWYIEAAATLALVVAVTIGAAFGLAWMVRYVYRVLGRHDEATAFAGGWHPTS